MGKHLRHKSNGISVQSSHPGCMWNILHILKYHHWRSIKRRLPIKRRGGGRNAVGDEIPGNYDRLQEQNKAEMDNYIDGKKMTQSTPATKNSVTARIKALISEERSKRKGRHLRSSTYSVRSHLTRTDSIHHLQPSDQNAHAEMVSDDASPSLVDRNNESSCATSSLDPVLLKFSEEVTCCEKNCEECCPMLTADNLGHNQVDKNGKQPIDYGMLFQESLEDTKQALSQKKLIHVRELTADASLHQSNELLDALDLINMNKEFFFKILQDPGSLLAHHFHSKQALSAKMGLTKSGTFPLSGSSDRRDPGPSKLNLKQEGNRSHVKEEEKLKAGNHTQKYVGPESTEDMCKQSAPYIASEFRAVGLKLNQTMGEIVDNSSSGSSKHLNFGHGNQMVIKRFKDLKQKIKHAIKESKKERHRITMDAILHKIPHSQGFSKDLRKDIFDHLKDTTMDRDGTNSPVSSYDSDHSARSIGKNRWRHLKRTSSLGEALDRYRRLYESSFNRKAKDHTCEKLKLRTEEVALPSRTDPKSLGRIFSSPELRSCYYPSEDSPDALSSETPATTGVDSTVSMISSFDEQRSIDLPVTSEYHLHLDAPVKSEIQGNLVDISKINPVIGDQMGLTSVENNKADAKVNDIFDYLGNLITRDNVSHNEQDIGTPKKSTTELVEPIPIPVHDSNYQEDITRSAEFSTSEDAELKLRQLLPDELDSLANYQLESSTDIPTVVASIDSPRVAENEANLEKEEILSKHSNSDIQQVQVDAKDKAEFNYVRDVLELSGFSGNESLGTWHSDDQPMDASLYEEVVGCMVLDLDCSGSTEEGGNCNHLLLFDLINEVLMELYENSYSYYPKSLTSLSHIRPMPAGYHVLEEVWTQISWYLSSRPGADQSLDYVVSRDLAKNDGWMNLQFDTECVGLELEDLIFDDLLEEAIWT